MFESLRVCLLVLLIGAAAAPALAQTAPRDSASSSLVQQHGAAVRPGDGIRLRIWNEPAMSGSYNVSETGVAILPKLGSVFVMGQSVASLQDSLRTAYSVYLRNPSVEVVVLRRIAIQGEVESPAIVMADLTMGLSDVIALAGGLTEAGNPDNILVLRGTERIRYRRSNQAEFLVAGLQSGDQVIVQPKNIFARNPMGAMGAIFGVTTVILAIVPLLRDDSSPNPR